MARLLTRPKPEEYGRTMEWLAESLVDGWKPDCRDLAVDDKLAANLALQYRLKTIL